MNYQIQSTSIPHVLILLVLLLPLLYGCAATVESRSPLNWGYGVNLTPGWQIGESSNSAHAILGYSRIGFTGGHNNNFQFGGQFRHSIDPASEDGIWVGGEAGYIRVVNVFDNNSSSNNPSASGYTLGGLAGYRFKVGTVPVSGYVSPSYLSVGAFKSNGTSFGSSSNGFYGKIGFDIHFMSLLNPKGR